MVFAVRRIYGAEESEIVHVMGFIISLKDGDTRFPDLNHHLSDTVTI